MTCLGEDYDVRSVQEEDCVDLFLKCGLGFQDQRAVPGSKGTCNFAFCCFQLEAGKIAKEVQFLKLYFEVLYCAGCNANVVCVAVVIVCNDNGCVLMELVGRVVSSSPHGKPSQKGLHEYGEQEWGQGVRLECSSLDRDGGGVAMDGHLVCF